MRSKSVLIITLMLIITLLSACNQSGPEASDKPTIAVSIVPKRLSSRRSPVIWLR